HPMDTINRPSGSRQGDRAGVRPDWRPAIRIGGRIPRRPRVGRIAKVPGRAAVVAPESSSQLYADPVLIAAGPVRGGIPNSGVDRADRLLTRGGDIAGMKPPIEAVAERRSKVGSSGGIRPVLWSGRRAGSRAD